MEARICTKCNKEKNINEFPLDIRYNGGRQRRCLSCKAEYNKNWMRSWAQKNPDKSKERGRDWRKKNTAKKREYQLKYNKENADKIRESERKYVLLHPDKYVKANNKKRSTPQGKLSHNISLHINHSLHSHKGYYHWENLTGYTTEQLKSHLEKQFKDGMSWSNYGSWHVDHIIPISAFNFETARDIDFKRCWDLRNLQPLWAKDNLRKWAKLDKPFQPSLLL